MKKKCFKKTVSWALSIVMSATMAVTPVLADTFTDGSQLIVSEDAGEETPAATISDLRVSLSRYRGCSQYHCLILPLPGLQLQFLQRLQLKSDLHILYSPD